MRRIFFLLYAAVAVCLVTPVARFAWRPEPLIFGLPPAIVWVVALLGVMFTAVLVIFLREGDSESDAD